jgi:hypothetical protein
MILVSIADSLVLTYSEKVRAVTIMSRFLTVFGMTAAIGRLYITAQRNYSYLFSLLTKPGI